MNVLFIGNSYTHYNNLPGMLQSLAQKSGKTLSANMVTCGGKTLEWHIGNPQTLETVAKGRWDYIILQDHSLEPIDHPERLCRSVLTLNDNIRNAGAQPVLYVTWARKNSPYKQDQITTEYTQVAKEIDALLAPVGPAWQHALAKIENLTLHMEDESHPRALGSYLASCVFYSALFNCTAVGLPNEYALEESITAAIDMNMAIALQEAADKAMNAIDCD